MTAAQKARLAGFNASMSKRGVQLTLTGTEHEFDALVENINTVSEEFIVGEEQREFSRVHILRSAPGIEHISYGSVLAAPDGTTHKVFAAEKHDIKTVFRCETHYA